MLTREAGEPEGVRRRARKVATHQFEHGRLHFPVRVRGDMGDARDPHMGAVNEGNRAFDVAKSPRGSGQSGHSGDAGVQPLIKLRYKLPR